MKPLLLLIPFLVILAVSNITVADIIISSELYHVSGDVYEVGMPSYADSYERTENYPIRGGHRDSWWNIWSEASRGLLKAYGPGEGFNPDEHGIPQDYYDGIAHAEWTCRFHSEEEYSLEIDVDSYDEGYCDVNFTLIDLYDDALIDFREWPDIDGSFSYSISPGHEYEFTLQAHAYGDGLMNLMSYAEIEVLGIPEPATIALLGLGAVIVRKRK